MCWTKLIESLYAFLLKRWKILLAATIFVIPYFIIYGAPFPEYLSRLINYGIFFTAVPIWIFWWSLDPNIERIPKSAKLAQPGYEKARGVAEPVIRLLFCLLSVTVVLTVTIPFIQDSANLIRGSRKSILQGVVENRSSYIGTSFINQNVMFSEVNGSSQSYRLMYSLRRLELGECVRCIVLPKSRLILEVLTTNTDSHCGYNISSMKRQ